MYRLLPVLVLSGLTVASADLCAQSWESTRVTDPEQHACAGPGGYPYRDKSLYVLGELDLEPGDVVVDIGAGDGWWTEKLATLVGETGLVYAAEIDQKKVDKMAERFADVPQVKPYLCPKDGTALDENSVDLVFLSKTYHHLDEHVDYLGHLVGVVKPTGRLCIIEKYPEISTKGKTHGWTVSSLVQQAEQAGWIPVRYRLITGTYHYIAIFVQQDLFPPEEQPEDQKKEVQEAAAAD